MKAEGPTPADDAPTDGSARQSRVWLIFFILGAVSAVGSPYLILGNAPDPPSPERFTGLTSAEIAARIPGIAGYIASISTQLGNFMLTTGVLMAAMAGGPFRRGQRLGWYAMWVVPVLLLFQFLNSNGGLGWQLDMGLLFVTIAGLIWSIPRFFRAGH